MSFTSSSTPSKGLEQKFRPGSKDRQLFLTRGRENPDAAQTVALLLHYRIDSGACKAKAKKLNSSLSHVEQQEVSVHLNRRDGNSFREDKVL